MEDILLAVDLEEEKQEENRKCGEAHTHKGVAESD